MPGALKASYYVTGGGSALVENLIMDGVPTMTTDLAASPGHVDHFFIQLVDADDVNLKFSFGGGAGKPAVENILLRRIRRAD